MRFLTFCLLCLTVVFSCEKNRQSPTEAYVPYSPPPAYLGYWQLFDTSNSKIPSQNLRTIAIDQNNGIWIGSYDNGLYYYDHSEWKHFHKDNSPIASNRIQSLKCDSKNNIWMISGPGQITKFDGQNWRIFDNTNSPIKQNMGLVELAISPSGILWICTAVQGIFKFDGEQWTNYYDECKYLKYGQPTSITVDEQEQVWLGSGTRGVAKFDGENWLNYDLGNSRLTNFHIVWIEAGPSQTIWIHPYKAGLCKFRENAWTVYLGIFEKPIKWLYPTCIGFDSAKNTWLVSEGEFLKFDGETWFSYAEPFFEKTIDTANAMAIDQNDNKWVATETGLLVFNENKLKF